MKISAIKKLVLGSVSLALLAVALVTSSQAGELGQRSRTTYSNQNGSWFTLFNSRGSNNTSYYRSSGKKSAPSMSNGSFYDKWRADRKASGRAHRP